MKKQYLWLVPLMASFIYAEGTSLQMTYENLDFSGSKKKDEGKREGIKLTHIAKKHRYIFAYEHTDTHTFQPPLSKDLKVDKYYLKYRYTADKKQAFSLSYATINDNLMHQTDGGNIYGLGYRYGTLKFTQYISDYKHFNVYQSDVSYRFKNTFDDIKVSATVLAKYIYLQDRKSNPFSKNAKENYTTVGVKLHAYYKGYHFGTGVFLGERIFAVMNNGLRVQHHAMAFNKTYMCGIGKHFNWGKIHLKYVHQEATEIPIDNKNVKVNNLIFQMEVKL